MNRDFRIFFERHLGPLRWRANGEASTRCPFHDDRRPSLSVNRYKGAWKCHACCGEGGIRDFARRLGVSPPWR